VKRMTLFFFSREGADRRRDRAEIDNFYYSAIYYVIREPNADEAKAIILKRLKAKSSTK